MSDFTVGKLARDLVSTLAQLPCHKVQELTLEDRGALKNLIVACKTTIRDWERPE